MGSDRLPSSGIKVIIVGAGFAGLTAAIECDRKGHDVTVFERASPLRPLGDIISFGQNASRIFAKWPGVMEKMEPIVHKSDAINFFNWEGKFVTSQSFESERRLWGRRINGHRGELHKLLYEHALERGIEVRLGQNVTDYFEDDDCAGIEVNGMKHTSDVVFAAEGVKSKGRKIVLGFDDKPQSSGYAVFRAWMPTEGLRQNDLTKHLVQSDSHNAWLGQDIHFIAAAIKDGAELSWVCTHKDETNIEESWQFPGKVEDALKILDGWAPVVQELVKATPPDRLFDYKLVYREPLPTFVSAQGRIALIGDAAHPFLPTSIQGASQAMEDGVTLAACLDIGGKQNVKQAMQVYERIRYERVHKIQATGVTTRDKWHKADWDLIWQDPTLLHLKREAWILNFDAEENTYSMYESVRRSLENQTEAGTELHAD
jgi:2-polyprenyl-6-methoxyphenol hydroxylase-like FAD-dependent oxidoreductase